LPKITLFLFQNMTLFTFFRAALFELILVLHKDAFFHFLLRLAPISSHQKVIVQMVDFFAKKNYWTTISPVRELSLRIPYSPRAFPQWKWQSFWGRTDSSFPSDVFATDCCHNSTKKNMLGPPHFRQRNLSGTCAIKLLYGRN